MYNPYKPAKRATNKEEKKHKNPSEKKKKKHAIYSQSKRWDTKPTQIQHIT